MKLKEVRKKVREFMAREYPEGVPGSDWTRMEGYVQAIGQPYESAALTYAMEYAEEKEEEKREEKQKMKYKTWNDPRMDYAYNAVKNRVKKEGAHACIRLAGLAKEMAFLPIDSGGAGEINEVQCMELIVAAHKQINDEKREKEGN